MCSVPTRTPFTARTTTGMEEEGRDASVNTGLIIWIAVGLLALVGVLAAAMAFVVCR